MYAKCCTSKFCFCFFLKLGFVVTSSLFLDYCKGGRVVVEKHPAPSVVVAAGVNA